MKKKNSILIITFLALLINCSSKKESNSELVKGVWILESTTNNLYVDDTTSTYNNTAPIIYDFNIDNNVTINYYGVKDTIVKLKWFFKSDSILTIENLDFKIHQLKKNKLTLVGSNRTDTYWLNFKKPQKTDLKYTKDEIKNILLSDLWKNEDGDFEFFKNKSMIFRHKMNKTDSLDFLQNENWGIAEYKNYFFLYNYSDYFLGKGSWEQINQILSISPEQFRLDHNNNTFFKSIFYRNQKNANIEIHGNWKSKNSKNKNYGKYYSKRQVERGNTQLFEGEMFLKIDNDFIELRIDTLNLGKYKFQIGKDKRTILLERKYEGEFTRGSFISLADIINKNDTTLEVHFMDNQFSTGLEKPYTIIVNKVQTFEKID
ncbi:hypothetical protein [uncultured Tenacibaculum sp.]|uniref:hypothetical protein n=1 Tax=uncultured Tenacibaculum sp. TaxID=174713 RepID=UPI002628D1F0|nr:hypothetical protein [uncultured Tenacibaculum sp.]